MVRCQGHGTILCDAFRFSIIFHMKDKFVTVFRPEVKFMCLEIICSGIGKKSILEAQQ